MRLFVTAILMGLALGADTASAHDDEEDVVVVETDRKIIDVERRYSTLVTDLAGPARDCEQTTVERIERDGTRVVNREEVCY